jgi:hypothetical protein
MRALRPRSRRSRAVLRPLLALAAIACAGCSHDAGGASQPAASVPRATTVTSSLARRLRLPLRVPWTATTSLPSDQVREVRFTIDRGLRWVDDTAPYSYAGDGGFLVTTWLRPGPHDFIVQVVASDGTVTTTHSQAGVAEPPLQRAAFGIWGRKLTTAGAARNGRWVLYIDADGGMWEVAPRGQSHAYQYSTRGSTLTVGAPIVLGPPGADGSHTGYTVGGWDCAPNGPTGTYDFRVLDRTGRLVLAARREPCKPRGEVLEGTWRRLD